MFSRLLACALLLSLSANFMLWQQLKFQDERGSKQEHILLPHHANPMSLKPSDPQQKALNSSTSANQTQQTAQFSRTTLNSQQVIQQAEAAFQRADYYVAVDLLQDVQQLDEIHASNHFSQLKNTWLDSLATWINQQNIEQSSQFLAAMLNYYPHDKAFMPLQAELHVVTGNILEAVRVYDDLLPYAENQSEVDAWLQTSAKLVIRQVESLVTRAQWHELIDFIDIVEVLNEQLIATPAWKIEALIALQNYAEAEYQLEILSHQPEFNVLVDELRGKIIRLQAESIAIPIQVLNNQMAVTARLDEESDVKLLIDTGAAMTVISDAAFQRLRSRMTFDFVREQRMNTAGGYASADIYRINLLSLQDARVTPIQIAVMPLNLNHGLEGLLGMNFLRFYQFHFERQQNTLWLKANGT
ncbi:retropepsin-like aspartic protease family protein [Saccharobesus litoralis]|nr:retropepsin-like aspartic protease [Saccharobesus litoralis]